MEDVTRQQLIEWFDSDLGLTDGDIDELNTALNDARQATFEEFGFTA